MTDLGNKNEELTSVGKKKEVLPTSKGIDAKDLYSTWLLNFYGNEQP
jgi:hypothetical protein